ncbi:MAG: TolC family protein [Bacteroidales bacterium]
MERRQIAVTAFLCLLSLFGYGQNNTQYGVDGRTIPLKMTLNDVIETAKEQSLTAMVAKHNFIVNYWQFRTYKAQFLPSLNLGSNLGEYNRSLVAVQNSETGEINYVNNDNLKNSLSLSIDQNIPFTGGKFSVYTSLYRLDQFAPDNSVTYNSQPINISYTQPIRAFNSLKWEKKIEPKKFERAKMQYLESMENVVTYATQLFFELLLSQKELELAQSSSTNAIQLYAIAQERFKIGSVSKDELLQLKLRTLNNEISLRDKELAVKSKMMKLRNYLGFNESVNLTLDVPKSNFNLLINYEDVMHNVNVNSSFSINNDIDKLEAEKEIAKAKANVGLQAELYAQFGLTQIGKDLGDAYKSPLNQEIIGLTIKLPIMDWGLGRGSVKVAKSMDKVVELKVEQAENEKKEDILFKVLQFNLQGSQCVVSAQADTIGRERFDVTKQRFLNGLINVTELNTAQNEMDDAAVRYLKDLSNYWNYYYNIRKLSLYDYLNDQKLTVDFEKLSGEKL